MEIGQRLGRHQKTHSWEKHERGYRVDSQLRVPVVKPSAFVLRQTSTKSKARFP